MKILSADQEKILQRERSFLNDLRVKLVDYGATRADLDTLGQSIRQLDDLFLLVIVGEFNAGKSAFINALLGQRLLKEGVTPTTSQINILRFGEKAEQALVEENHQVILLPVELLAEVSIVDTPGTNAINRQHEELTTHFVPRADLVLFLTSVDRPFTESERSFMAQIRDWGKKVIIVINKTDILQSETELAQVVSFVRDNATALLGTTPEIFPLSARLAMRAKNGEPDLWQASGFEALETYIKRTLDQKSQVRLKFVNPLGVGAHLVDKYYQAVQAQREVLDKDLELLRNVDQQQEIYMADKQKNFSFRMADIENIFFEMEQRGDVFFEDRFRLAKVMDLFKRERMQEDFKREVVADVPKLVEQKVNELIDWLVESDLRQWKAITGYLADRQHEHKERLIGDGMNANFNYDRSRLLEAIGDEAERVVDTYDKHKEAEEIAIDAQNAVAASLAVEVGAVGLGTLITVLATTATADLTGILAAGVIAALGFFIIPSSRRKAKEDLHERLAKLRDQLVGSLKAEFEQEMVRSNERIDEAIAPYTRFVRAESARTDKMHDELKQANLEIDQLRATVEGW